MSELVLTGQTAPQPYDCLLSVLGKSYRRISRNCGRIDLVSSKAVQGWLFMLSRHIRFHVAALAKNCSLQIFHEQDVKNVIYGESLLSWILSFFIVFALQYSHYGIRIMVFALWCSHYGFRIMVFALWYSHYGYRIMVFALWYQHYGILIMVYVGISYAHDVPLLRSCCVQY